MHSNKPLTFLASLRIAMIVGTSGIALSAQAQLGSTLQATSDPSSAAVVHQAQNTALQWQESVDANQIRVRQYLSAAGQVYAVSWDGPAMANVAALLGTWFDAYQASAVAAQAGTQSLHALHVERSDLVVETAVRLRDFHGRAWLPAAIPAGVTTADIQ